MDIFDKAEIVHNYKKFDKIKKENTINKIFESEIDSDLPEDIRFLPQELRILFVDVWNNVFVECVNSGDAGPKECEQTAFSTAMKAVKDAQNKSVPLVDVEDVLELREEIEEIGIGITKENQDHNHAYAVEINNGEVIAGATNIVSDHWHYIQTQEETKRVKNHNHEFEVNQTLNVSEESEDDE